MMQKSDMRLWTFEALDRDDPERGAHLRGSPSWLELVRQTRDALHVAIEAGQVRFGFDESSRDIRDLRGVIQFPVDRRLFDWLFNSRSGYRAQFRIGSDNGLRKNALIISELVDELRLVAPQEIVAHLLTHDFEYKGSMVCAIGQVVQSFDTAVSKLWACGRLIGQTGEIQDVSLSYTGPKLVFPDAEAWPSLYPGDTMGWLDMKGAFSGPGGFYQLKSPNDRAAKLEDRGTA